jgi:hypothetical protein
VLNSHNNTTQHNTHRKNGPSLWDKGKVAISCDTVLKLQDTQDEISFKCEAMLAIDTASWRKI